MTKDDWYRNTTWNYEIETGFEDRLKRSRGSYNKAQYLRIQASYLLESSEESTQMIGVRLIERLLNEFQSEEATAIFGIEQLGDYYLRTGQLDLAEEKLSLVCDYYEDKKTRSGTSFKADLKLAEILLQSHEVEKYKKAYSLCKNYPTKHLILNNDKFYYAELTAHVCDKLNKTEEAKEYAKIAIELARISEPQFYRHKTVGIINLKAPQLRSLEEIVAE